MTDLKQAYETLGLPENASREDVEKAFDLQLRKSRNRQQDANLTDGEESEFSIKLKAYKQIVEYEDRLIIQGKNQERYSKWGRFSGTAEKVDDFFRLYKFRVIISVIAVIVLIFGINAFIDHREEQKRLAALPPIDLSILYIGNFITNDTTGRTDELEKAMTEQFPEFQRLGISLTFLPPEGDGAGGAGMAYQQKAMAVLATESPDIYIMDKPTIEWIGRSGVLQNLDDVAEGALKPFLTTDKTIKVKTEDDTTEHIYGIDVSDSPLFNELPISKREVILTVRDGSKNFDKAMLFIQRYLEGTETGK
ncbi:molecular chaperone DnaJ [Paenibacillus segetis]|uniref:J domain-containing protein n=1 Tax=Paenibacillus segetis TaxID=1325360 RepID=A0ABQ1Y9C7_9BACL|nr:molecular chaperone DnaJ [Paenibacillus segetis]GGH16460.1 hypothetical protein GCM10008013_11250 [Paenibacillus segetis]